MKSAVVERESRVFVDSLAVDEARLSCERFDGTRSRVVRGLSDEGEGARR